MAHYSWLTLPGLAPLLPVEVELFNRVNHVTLIGSMAPPRRGLAPVLDRFSAFLRQRPT